MKKGVVTLLIPAFALTLAFTGCKKTEQPGEPTATLVPITTVPSDWQITLPPEEGQTIERDLQLFMDEFATAVKNRDYDAFSRLFEPSYLADMASYLESKGEKDYSYLTDPAGQENLIRRMFNIYSPLVMDGFGKPEIFAFERSGDYVYFFARWISEGSSDEGGDTVGNLNFSAAMKRAGDKYLITTDKGAQEFLSGIVEPRLLPENARGLSEGKYYVQNNAMLLYPIPLAGSVDTYVRSIIPDSSGGYDAELLLTNGKQVEVSAIEIAAKLYDADGKLFYGKTINLKDQRIAPGESVWYKFKIKSSELKVKEPDLIAMNSDLDIGYSEPGGE